ncbi:MAG: hypothetical protein NTU44_20125 [Bacteroidetes bacterium]|nr:hypothetical protein [Bacteroidota bacterium]
MEVKDINKLNESQVKYMHLSLQPKNEVMTAAELIPGRTSIFM